MAMNLRLSTAQQHALNELAAAQGVSKNEAAARAIEDAWARQAHQRRVRELGEAAIDRYRDLLDRLAQ
ncbi:CopG family transcriptional regulator [Georgenia sp. TF02-10]|uniref:CopG family transcriptional regulator n=1 Tax=Georgenia sp. TF02-10 TaxID=2917725 RepID=UPI001FA7E689|nr:CopG family transcriptional regulator [Georgenia sp. TF02-10]UNX53936.1 CopG family transcriptional regulator [Georgenia sp. TF02-10]